MSSRWRIPAAVKLPAVVAATGARSPTTTLWPLRRPAARAAVRRRSGRTGRGATGTVMVALVAVLLAACSSASPSAPADMRPATPARLEIITPASGAVVEPHATLRVKLSGAKLTTTPLSGGDLPTDQGFVHLYVDDKLVSVLYGLTQKLPTLDAGAHTLRVEFVAADHAPFANQVVATTQFSVRP